MPTLQEIASETSSVPVEKAFRLDSKNLYEQLGHSWFVSLSKNFYRRVYADPEPWFRAIFASSTEDEAAKNQYEWLVQRCGGPPLYSNRKGHPGLLGRHAHFDVSVAAAERWLQHMGAAMQETEMPATTDPDAKESLMDFFRHTAHFLVAGQCIRESSAQADLQSDGTSNKRRALQQLQARKQRQLEQRQEKQLREATAPAPLFPEASSLDCEVAAHHERDETQNRVRRLEPSRCTFALCVVAACFVVAASLHHRRRSPTLM
eukprot:TRINITY_DN908_c0_g2_i1.p1 TRINITY_DN908_c0_g2~~TRINITY_DN908_c0_g2_i1.p1  ORF type:complete len:270 (-),score=45.61 TRINITY_DN908_c0_g2_i1:373-1158(-)